LSALPGDSRGQAQDTGADKSDPKQVAAPETTKKDAEIIPEATPAIKLLATYQHWIVGGLALLLVVFAYIVINGRSPFWTLVHRYGDRYTVAFVYIAFVIVSCMAAFVLYGVLQSSGVLKLALTGGVREAEFGGAFAGFFATLFWLVHSYNRTTASPTAINLTGTVLTPDGVPAEGAKVIVEGLAIQGATNDAGWFSIEVKDRPQWTLRARYKDMVTQATVKRQNKDDPVRLVIQAAGEDQPSRSFLAAEPLSESDHEWLPEQKRMRDATYWVEAAKVDDLDTLYKLYQSAFGLDLTPKEQMKKWVAKNSAIAWIVFRAPEADSLQRELVGFFDVEPLTKGAVRRLEEKEADARSMSDADIMKSTAQAVHFYIGSVGAVSAKHRWNVELCFLDRIAYLSSKKAVTFYARPVTDDGLRLLRRNDFAPISKRHGVWKRNVGIGEVSRRLEKIHKQLQRRS
jgi:hypothetical protein